MKLMQINGDITVTGVVDPAGVTFTLQGSNPLPATTSGLWFDSSGNIIHTRDGYPDLNVTQTITTGAASALTASYVNGTGSTLAAFIPVSANSAGLIATDVTSEALANACLGLTSASTLNGANAAVTTHGQMLNVTITGAAGEAIYVGVGGTLTNTEPSVGVNGFQPGYFVIKVGTLIKNQSNSAHLDLIVNVQLIGQL
jgi:hypothetical protein